jgi:hypothetical protein
MAPVVKLSLPETIQGLSEEVSEPTETENGSQQFPALNHVTEAPPAIGNVKVIFALENLSVFISIFICQ